MTNSNTQSEVLEKLALEILAKRERADDLVLLRSDEEVDQSTGETVYRFLAWKKSQPNGPRYEVALNEAGETVGVASLKPEGGKRPFAIKPPPFGPPPIKKTGKPITINPTTNDLVLKSGDRFCEDITVNVPECYVAPLVDVYFLADTTGSMQTILTAVQNDASSILNQLNSIPNINWAFGVGDYKDFPQPQSAYAFNHQLSPTNNVTAADAAIQTWTASGGSDGPEGQLFALYNLAVPPGSPIGWRPGSKRIILWFGDAPGHEPICTSISSAPVINLALVIGNLQTQKITVIAASTTTGYPLGLDDDPTSGESDYSNLGCAPGGVPGQATAIANAYGGSVVSNVSPGAIVSTIVNQITAAVSMINNLSLVATGSIAPFVTISPAGGFGPLPSTDAHELVFDVSFKGVVDCGCKDQVFTGTIDAVADGIVVAQKTVTITVRPCRYTYSVKFVYGVQPLCDCEHAPVRPGAYATEINIHNFNELEARIEKRVLPVVFAGAPSGREPKYVGVKAKDKITLPPDSATMDDGFRLGELLLGAPPPAPLPLTIGFLEIVSDRELNVTAVYTASDPKSGVASIDVEQIEGRRK